jgi:hypothetical protein
MTGAKTLSKSQICIERPLNLNDHHKVHQERWGEFKDGKNIGTYTCQRGYSGYREMKSTTPVSVPNDGGETPWCGNGSGTNDEMPFRAQFNVGKEYTSNAEAVFQHSRNWPRFNGFSFETYNKNNADNTMYLRRVATCWENADGNKIYCATSLDGSGSRNQPGEYYYWSYIFLNDGDEQQLQDEGYRFTGFRFNYRSHPGTGSSSLKHVDVFNLKMHTNYPDMPDGTRVVLPKMVDINEEAVGGPNQYGDAA